MSLARMRKPELDIQPFNLADGAFYDSLAQEDYSLLRTLSKVETCKILNVQYYHLRVKGTSPFFCFFAYSLESMQELEHISFESQHLIQPDWDTSIQFSVCKSEGESVLHLSYRSNCSLSNVKSGKFVSNLVLTNMTVQPELIHT